MRRLLVALLLLGALAGCGGDPPPPPKVYTAPNGDRYNDVDTAFASRMIEDYAESLSLADLGVAPGSDPVVADVAADIRDRQAPVVEDLVTILQRWDLPIPETARDHANAHEDEGRAPLGRDAWLGEMVEHHETVLEVAADEVERGRNTDVTDLAAEIVEATEQELERLEALRRD